MRASVLGGKIDELVGAELLPLGFEPIRPRRWVQSVQPHIRGIFEFQSLKGNVYSARWGRSLDFVPLLRAGRLRWKRTANTADFDLCMDPIDEYGTPPDWCSFSRSAPPRESRMVLIVKEATRAAKLDFSRSNSVFDVVARFRERAAMRFRRFSLENYTQTHLAWGLSLIAVGELTEGEQHLKLFCARFSIDLDDRKMHQAILAAQESLDAAQESLDYVSRVRGS